MSMAANVDFYACMNAPCGWRWYQPRPKAMYGKLTTAVDPKVCPQCGGEDIVKS